MVKSSRSLRHYLMAGLCGSALLMGACSGGDKTPAEEITVDAASLELSQADATALSRYFQVAPRSGDEATTLQRLDSLELSASEDMLADRVIDGSTVSFTDWRTTSEDGTYTADSVTLIGLHEEDGQTTFDKMIVNNFAALTYEGEGDARTQTANVNVEELTVVSPTPDLALALARMIRGADGADVLDGDAANELSDTASFKALHLKAMTLDAAEDGDIAKARVGQIVVGNDADAEEADLIVESIDFDFRSGDDAADVFALKMDGMTALGLDTSTTQSAMQGTPLAGGLFENLLSPSGKLPYRQIDLGTVDFRSAMFDLVMDGFEADSDVDGVVTTLRSVLSPMIVTIKDAANTPVAPYMEVLRNNGLDVITLKGSQTMTMNSRTDRMAVSDARIEIDEGLRTRCDYTLDGINAAAAAMKATGLTPPELFITTEGDTTQEEREAQVADYIAAMEAYNAAQAEANSKIRIVGLNCDVQDVPGNSLVERGYAVASEITGSPVAVLKGSAKTAIALGSMMAPSEFERDLMDTVGSGLIDFIDTPGQTMRITMAPENPVPITSLTGQAGEEPTIKPLGLSVEVK